MWVKYFTTKRKQSWWSRSSRKARWMFYKSLGEFWNMTSAKSGSSCLWSKSIAFIVPCWELNQKNRIPRLIFWKSKDLYHLANLLLFYNSELIFWLLMNNFFFKKYCSKHSFEFVTCTDIINLDFFNFWFWWKEF